MKFQTPMAQVRFKVIQISKEVKYLCEVRISFLLILSSTTACNRKDFIDHSSSRLILILNIR